MAAFKAILHHYYDTFSTDSGEPAPPWNRPKPSIPFLRQSWYVLEMHPTEKHHQERRDHWPTPS